MRRRLAGAAIAAVMASLLVTAIDGSMSAMAAGVPSGASSGDTVDSSNSYYATPDELEALGRPQAEIDAQRKAIAALSPAEKARQDALRAEQTPLTQQFEAKARVGVGARTESVASPLTSKASCSLTTSYEVGLVGGGGDCFTGEGYYAELSDNSFGLWTGAWEGRVLYYNWYVSSSDVWSVWEPPSNSWHYFSNATNTGLVHEVELQSCPTC